MKIIKQKNLYSQNNMKNDYDGNKFNNINIFGRKNQNQTSIQKGNNTKKLGGNNYTHNFGNNQNPSFKGNYRGYPYQ